MGEPQNKVINYGRELAILEIFHLKYMNISLVYKHNLMWSPSSFLISEMKIIKIRISVPELM